MKRISDKAGGKAKFLTGFTPLQIMRKPGKKARFVTGFTLIELLIVIALFAAGAAVLLQIFSVSLYAGAENENTIVAAALAQEKMEEIRNEPYASISAEPRAQVPNYTFFDMELLVAVPMPNLKQVTVNVYWKERSGDVRTSLVTYVSDI